jgi:Transcription factor subunit Med10 of Mediator complex
MCIRGGPARCQPRRRSPRTDRSSSVFPTSAGLLICFTLSFIVPSFFTMSSSSSSSTAGSRALQETLHVLLTRISATMEHVQNWPSEQQQQQQQQKQAHSQQGGNSSSKSSAAGTDTNIHVSSTTQLIHHLNQVVTALQRVEGTIQSDAGLRKSLQECMVPVDLLDLLDSSKLNPDVFARGLLREALGQLAGLRRRKLALEMLGSAIQSGIQKRKRRKQLMQLDAAPSAVTLATTTVPSDSHVPTYNDGGRGDPPAPAATATTTTTDISPSTSSSLPSAKRQRTD